MQEIYKNFSKNIIYLLTKRLVVYILITYGEGVAGFNNCSALFFIIEKDMLFLKPTSVLTLYQLNRVHKKGQWGRLIKAETAIII